jgi:sRNA-binding protein
MEFPRLFCRIRNASAIDGLVFIISGVETVRERLDLLADLYPHCFNRLNRRPLKVGVCEEVITQHSELSRHRIKGLLKEYTQHELYWSTLKAGTARIGLDGNVAGEVTLEDEQHALIQMARMARRVAAREAEARKASGQAVEERAERQKPTSEAKSQQPAPGGPSRLGLAGLKAAALKRRQLVAAK